MFYTVHVPSGIDKSSLGGTGALQDDDENQCPTRQSLERPGWREEVAGMTLAIRGYKGLDGAAR
jgi:hypothetical protein